MPFDISILVCLSQPSPTRTIVHQEISLGPDILPPTTPSTIPIHWQASEGYVEQGSEYHDENRGSAHRASWVG